LEKNSRFEQSAPHVVLPLFGAVLSIDQGLLSGSSTRVQALLHSCSSTRMGKSLCYYLYILDLARPQVVSWGDVVICPKMSGSPYECLLFFQLNARKDFDIYIRLKVVGTFSRLYTSGSYMYRAAIFNIWL
jgi:hypothetical protein